MVTERFEIGEELFTVPYDYDLSGIVNASYARPPEVMRIRKVTTRAYRGYCRTPADAVARALDDIVDLREEIMATVAATPAITEKDQEERLKYIGRFFEEAADDREKLLKQFEKDCIGKR